MLGCGLLGCGLLGCGLLGGCLLCGCLLCGCLLRGFTFSLLGCGPLGGGPLRGFPFSLLGDSSLDRSLLDRSPLRSGPLRGFTFRLLDRRPLRSRPLRRSRPLLRRRPLRRFPFSPLRRRLLLGLPLRSPRPPVDNSYNPRGLPLNPHLPQKPRHQHLVHGHRHGLRGERVAAPIGEVRERGAYGVRHPARARGAGRGAAVERGQQLVENRRHVGREVGQLGGPPLEQLGGDALAERVVDGEEGQRQLDRGEPDGERPAGGAAEQRDGPLGRRAPVRPGHHLRERDEAHRGIVAVIVLQIGDGGPFLVRVVKRERHARAERHGAVRGRGVELGGPGQDLLRRGRPAGCGTHGVAVHTVGRGGVEHRGQQPDGRAVVGHQISERVRHPASLSQTGPRQRSYRPTAYFNVPLVTS